jgi:hypothetical protein
MSILKWSYSDALCDSRKEALERAPSFEDITESVVQRMRVQCRHVDPGNETPPGYERIVYCVHIDRPLFDLFFNSRNGYRAWYFRSPDEGVRMNELFLKSLAKALRGFQSSDGVDPKMIARSLSAPSGKVWLAEVGKGFRSCPKCYGDWRPPQDGAPEILNGRWEHSTTLNGIYGRKAPFLEYIRICGAFVNERGEDYVPKRKLHRATEIHECGWT